MLLKEKYNLSTALKYEAARGFYIQIPKSDLEQFDHGNLPPEFTNKVKRKNYIECQTVELMKKNQKVTLPSQSGTGCPLTFR
jgi:DNA mismatch repair protein MSH4